MKERNVFLERWTEISDEMKCFIPWQKKIPEAAEKAVAIRARIERCKAFPEEKEVLSIIYEMNPQLEAGDLRMMRKDCDAWGIVLLEYQHDPYPYTTYIYVNERCKDPDYLGMGRKKEPMKHPDATALFRLGISGKLEEVFRWNEDDYKET